MKVLLFENIEFVGEFDAVWANACLLHVLRSSLSAVFGRIHRALRAGGAMYASFKTGGEETIDQYDRYYNFPDEALLRSSLGPGWSSVEMVQQAAPGYYNLPADWLHVTALKA